MRLFEKCNKMSVSTRTTLRDVYRSLFSARRERRRKLLVKFLEDHCKTQNEMVGNDEKSSFDFVYLPIDINRVHIQAEPSPQPTEDVARSHGDDDGGEDRPLHTMYPAVTWVALLTEEITDTKGPVLIQFELRDKQTIMPLSDHAAHWSSYIGEVIRGRTWNPPIGQRSTRASSSTCKRRTITTRLLSRPSFRNIARAAQNQQNRAKSTVISGQGSRSLARLRDEMTLTTQEYPWLIDTFFMAHTVTGNSFGTRTDEDIRRLEAMGTYTDDEINRLARGGSSEGTLPFKSGGASGSGGCGDEEEGAVRTRRMRMAMAILNCIIYDLIVTEEGIPYERSPATFPRDKSPGKGIPSDKSPGKPQIVDGEST
nr:hypothetical protein [Tanacetum cinerariifolium]